MRRRTHERGNCADDAGRSRTGVLLSGYYGCGNLGDDLLLTVAVKDCARSCPERGFCCATTAPTCRTSDRTSSPPASTRSSTIARDRGFPAHRLHRAHGGLLRQCRWLVFGGGTVFHDNGGLASLALQWLICHLARALGVRIAALGVGVGDLRTATGRRLLRGIIARCELFLVRDDAALRQCAGTKARLTADLVFAWRALQPGSVRSDRRSTVASA